MLRSVDDGQQKELTNSFTMYLHHFQNFLMLRISGDIPAAYVGNQCTVA